MPISVLLIDGDCAHAQAVVGALVDPWLDWAVEVAPSLAHARPVLARQQTDVVLTVRRVVDGTAFDVLELLDNVPALLKGYIDRVFANGFAYSIDTNGLHPLLTDKTVMIFNTTGLPEEIYRSGYADAIKKTLDTGTYGLCGMKIALHKFFYGVPYVDNTARADMLKEIEAIQFP